VDRVWNDFWSVDAITAFGLRYMKSVQYRFSFFGVFGFLGKSVVQQDIASLGFNVLNTFFGEIRHLNQVGI